MNDTNDNKEKIEEILEEARKSLKNMEKGSCKIERNEEETKISVVMPIAKYIMSKLKIDLCNVEIYPNRDIALYKNNKLSIIIEVKSFKPKSVEEFNFFNLFCKEAGKEKKEIGALKWEKYNGEKKIVHINHDGVAQLRGYCVELYTKKEEKSFKPILTNGKYWILFNERFYKNNGGEIEYKGGIGRDNFNNNKNLFFPPICPNLEVVDAISSILWEGENEIEIKKWNIDILNKSVKELLEELTKKYKDENIENKFISFPNFINQLIKN